MRSDFLAAEAFGDRDQTGRFREVLAAYRRQPYFSQSISDGGKVRPHKELFLIQSDYSVRYGLTLFILNLHIELPHTPPFIHGVGGIHRRPAHYHYALHERTFLFICMTYLLPQVE